MVSGWGFRVGFQGGGSGRGFREGFREGFRGEGGSVGGGFSGGVLVGEGSVRVLVGVLGWFLEKKVLDVVLGSFSGGFSFFMVFEEGVRREEERRF